MYVKCMFIFFMHLFITFGHPLENLLCHLNVYAFFSLQEARLLTLIEGVLAANIFDWGSRACVDLYHKGTIIEIYRMSRDKMQRPWRVNTKNFPYEIVLNIIDHLQLT